MDLIPPVADLQKIAALGLGQRVLDRFNKGVTELLTPMIKALFSLGMPGAPWKVAAPS